MGEFQKILNTETKSQISQFLSLIVGKGVVEFTVLINIDIGDLKRFGLNRDIKFGMHRSLGGSFQMRYFYKNLEITPDADFINGSSIDTLGMLRACIEQNTDTPEV